MSLPILLMPLLFAVGAPPKPQTPPSPGRKAPAARARPKPKRGAAGPRTKRPRLRAP